ncbi:hypothetical protein DFJ74DRAFT_652111 [Hyaloraphidium curvatum]|nr:hypothetical protein DFJ74DRAFT_652111 [Hyaloraphidium curvatum]
METVFGGPDPGADVFVESSLQILTVSEADGINKGARSGDLLQGVKAGMWGTDASNAASNVFPGFVVAKRSKASKRVVSRAAFVKVPRGCVTLPKESVAALMEIVEQRLHADRLVVVVERLQDDEALRKAWVRAFTMIGFEMSEFFLLFRGGIVLIAFARAVNPSAMPFNSDKFLLLACDF